MKKFYLTLILFSCAFTLTKAQNNYPTSGTVGIGTSTLTTGLGLNLVYPYGTLKLEGANSGSITPEIVISRTSALDQVGRSPGIGFVDASNPASYIQAFQGNLNFWTGTTIARTLSVTTGNRVGVMVSAPSATFQVESLGTKLCVGGANNSAMNGTSYVGFNAGRTTTNQWRVDVNGYGGAVIYGDQAGNINFAGLPNGGAGGFVNYTDADVKSRTYFQVTGTGVARAKVLKIELTGWSDYVFDKMYKLPSLQSVKTYIDKNHHLPDMPSAAEVIADGLNVGEVNKTLTKKVEEITLYLIEKDKQLEEQHILIQQQQKMLLYMQQQVKQLANKVNKKSK